MGRALQPIAVIAVMLVFATGQAGAAGSAYHLSGGGTASISQFAMNVAIDGSGSASGSFECLMAGRSGFVLGAFGLAHNMIVHATPTSASVAGSVVSFKGTALLALDGSTRTPVHVQVCVNVATQQFQLTVVEVGAMPVEPFLSGGVRLT